jgi:ribosomal protein L28
MAVCILCDKKPVRTVWSRHKKGSSGHGGDWNLKAPISKKTQHPNLHVFKGAKYCTKCLRLVKSLSPHTHTAQKAVATS